MKVTRSIQSLISTGHKSPQSLRHTPSQRTHPLRKETHIQSTTCNRMGTTTRSRTQSWARSNPRKGAPKAGTSAKFAGGQVPKTNKHPRATATGGRSTQGKMRRSWGSPRTALEGPGTVGTATKNPRSNLKPRPQATPKGTG